jgi:hypothetical protein
VLVATGGGPSGLAAKAASATVRAECARRFDRRLLANHIGRIESAPRLSVFVACFSGSSKEEDCLSIFCRVSPVSRPCEPSVNAMGSTEQGGVYRGRKPSTDATGIKRLQEIEKLGPSETAKRLRLGERRCIVCWRRE